MGLSRNDLNLIYIDKEKYKEFEEKMRKDFLIMEVAIIGEQFHKKCKKIMKIIEEKMKDEA